VAKGNISGEHVDALTVAAKGLDDDRCTELFDSDGQLEIAALRKLDSDAGKSRAQLSAIALVNLVCSTRTRHVSRLRW
jgi:uncharacterized protein YcbX